MYQVSNMTKVTIFYDNNLIAGFSMSGHANYNKSGQDIVCASLSTASIMTINGILDWIGLDYDEVVNANQEEGYLKIMLEKEFYESIVVQQLYKAFLMFLSELATTYPENVSYDENKKHEVNKYDNSNS